MRGILIIKRTLRLLSFLILLISFRLNSYAQSFTLPDTNFRNALLAKYPSVMTGNDLNIAAAKTFGFDLLIQNANISDLTGVQYFTSIYKLDASQNNISTVPDLSGLKNLAYLYLSQNAISNTSFFIHNTTLLQIHLFQNQLTSFPELVGFTKLESLLLTNNPIDSLTGLSNYPNLSSLLIGNTKMNTLPDISKNAKLIELHCFSNNLKDIDIVKNLPNLKLFVCWDNQLTNLSALDSNTALQELYASGNLLTSLPVLSNKPNLTKVSVANNKLTFEDLLPLANRQFALFEYAPQDSIGKQSIVAIRRLDQLSLIALFEEDKSNHYTWFKNSTQLSNSSSSFTINRAQLSDAGRYNVDIYNPALPSLTLHQRAWIVSINSNCMDINSYGYKILSKDCKEGTEIEVDVSTTGAQLPLQYSLTGSGKTDSIVSSIDIISHISSGIYKLSVTDLRGCNLTIDKELKIYRTADCDPVISPLTNGSQSSYFIEKPGLVRILDMNGNLIRELNAPAVWDGTKSDGSFADLGYYVITLNNKKLTNISVIR